MFPCPKILNIDILQRAETSKSGTLTVESRSAIPSGYSNLEIYLRSNHRHEFCALGIVTQDRIDSVALAVTKWGRSWKELGGCDEGLKEPRGAWERWRERPMNKRIVKDYLEL